MRKNPTKKLTLKKETLRTLNPKELRQVAGGGASNSGQSYNC